MRKSCVRCSLVVASAFVIWGQASAQSVSFWFNSFGDTATLQPPVINVVSGSTAKFSIYVKTTSIGALSGLNMLFGYSTSTSTGSAATPADTKASFNAFTWAQADLSGGVAQAGTGGGGVLGGGSGSRPWGYFVSTFLNGSNTFAGSGDGVNFKIADITLNINATAGSTIPISIWSSSTSATAGTDNYASAVVNAQSSEFFPTAPYNATLNVTAVPEPATMAALGLGAMALIRRRRR